MGRHLPRITLALILLALATPAFATQLWQDAKVGMSVDAIRGLYPEAEPGEYPKRGVHGTPKLIIKGYEVNNRDFNVEFFFENGGLNEVILRLQKASLSSREMPKIYEDLLRSRYGEPLSYYTESEPLPLIKATWTDGERDILLYWARVRQTDINMHIVYSTRIRDEGNKL
jgi:hypothetical protein